MTNIYLTSLVNQIHFFSLSTWQCLKLYIILRVERIQGNKKFHIVWYDLNWYNEPVLLLFIML